MNDQATAGGMPAKKAATRPRRPSAGKGPKKAPSGKPAAGSQGIDAKIKSLGDWRGKTLARLRTLIRAADPDVVEEVKWVKPSNPLGVPTWSHDGILCTGETYKDKVKLTFARGASLPDPKGLFNAKDTGSTRRAIDIHEGETVDPAAFRDLVQAAIEANQG